MSTMSKYLSSSADADVHLASAAIRSHLEDGSRSRFIASLIPVGVLDQRGENIHLIRAQRAQHSSIDSGLTSRLAEAGTPDSYFTDSVSASEIMET